MRTSSFFAKRPSGLMRAKIDPAIVQFRGGIHRSVLSGKGIEYKRLRQYSSLDSPVVIDDMASHRLSQEPDFEPYSRVRYTQKQVSTLVLLDVGAPMCVPQVKEVCAAHLFWFLALSAFKYMDRFRVIPYAGHPVEDSDWVYGEDELMEFLMRYRVLVDSPARFSAVRSVYSYVSRLELHDAAVFILSDLTCAWNTQPAELGRLAARERNVKLIFCAIDEWSEFVSLGYAMRLHDSRRGRVREFSSEELKDLRAASLARLVAVEESLRPLGATFIRFPILADPFSVFRQALRQAGFK